MIAMENKTRKSTRDFNWEFGCDGLLTLDEACDALRVSRKTIGRLCSDKFLRKGKSPRFSPNNKAAPVYICKRSVAEYMRAMEVGS